MRVVPLHVVIGGHEHSEGVDIDAAAVAGGLAALHPGVDLAPGAGGVPRGVRGGCGRRRRRRRLGPHLRRDVEHDRRCRPRRRAVARAGHRRRLARPRAWRWGTPCSPGRGSPPVARRPGRSRMPCAPRARHPRSSSTWTPSSTSAAAAGSARPVRCSGRRWRSSRSSDCETATSCRSSGCARRPGRSRGSRSCRSRRRARCPTDADGVDVAVHHLDSPERAERLAERLRSRLGDEVSVRVVELGPSWAPTSGRARSRRRVPRVVPVVAR